MPHQAESRERTDFRRVTLIAGSPPRLESEVRGLLGQRLRVAGLIVLGGQAAFFFRYSLEPATAMGSPLETWFMALTILAQAVLTGLAWTGRAFSMRQLRFGEMLSLAITEAFLAYVAYDSMISEAVVVYTSAGQDPDGISLVAYCFALPWFAVIVAYGAFIPNTWQRCGAVVAVLVLLPMAVTAAAGLRHPAAAPALLGGVLVEMTIWLAIAAAIAVYGSHKINVLRHEAFEARQLGQYVLKQRLGEGGMGEVYLAEHQLLRRPCAVKLIRAECMGDSQTLVRFEREVKATASLSHWNTVDIFDYGHTEDGTFYYVMEYLPGLDLEDMVNRHGPLAPERVIHLLRQVCAALHEAHARGLIHRDIKPGNIIACERGQVQDVVKLLDFGLVRTAESAGLSGSLTEYGRVMGTPLYMSPEQARGWPADARSDIYSLGAVAYFLLTGQPPFVRDSSMDVLAAHLVDPVAPPSTLRPDVSPDLQEVVLRCLEKDPARRFPNADSLDQALAECAAAGRWTQASAAAWWRNKTPGGGSHHQRPTTPGDSMAETTD
jgi:serine/threonine-protein kinase